MPVEHYNDNSCYLSEKCLDAEEFAGIDTQLFNKLYSLDSKKLKKHLYPSVRGNYCSAVQIGNFVVDPEGDLYTCWNIVGRKEKKIGNVIQKNPMNIEYLNWLTYEPSEKCLSCNILPICAGGCPYQFFEHNIH